MAEFLRFYNVRYCERVEVDDEGAAQQIRELVDDSMEANIDEIEVLLRDHGKVVSDEYVGDCDDPDANIEED